MHQTVDYSHSCLTAQTARSVWNTSCNVIDTQSWFCILCSLLPSGRLKVASVYLQELWDQNYGDGSNASSSAEPVFMMHVQLWCMFRSLYDLAKVWLVYFMSLRQLESLSCPQQREGDRFVLIEDLLLPFSKSISQKDTLISFAVVIYWRLRVFQTLCLVYESFCVRKGKWKHLFG